MPLLTATYQGASRLLGIAMHDIPFNAAWVVRAVQLPVLWAALAAEVMTFVIWTRILARTDLSAAAPLSAISYIAVMLTGWLGFHEPLGMQHIIGSALICAGVGCIGGETEHDA